MFRLIKKGVYKLNEMINKPEDKNANNLNYLEYQVKKLKESKKRAMQEKGYAYYNGQHDILKKKRTVIGQGGELEEVNNLPNARRIDNQYAIAVDKKVNYLLGRKPTYQASTEVQDSIDEEIQDIFNNSFNRTLKTTLQDSLNCGIAYMYVSIGDNKFKFKRLKPFECQPIWEDEEHTRLKFFIRLYKQTDFINGEEKVREYVEVYKKDMLTRYQLKGTTLLKKEDVHYIKDNQGKAYGWGDIPIIPFKYNVNEISLLERVKNLQDGINEIMSTYNDDMSENPRNSILILKNYDGQKLDEFRKNLNAYGAVKVKNDGGVSSLQVDVNSTNYLSILSLLKNALIENAKSYDAKDDRMSGNPNMMNIQSMYSDIDIDSNGIETEYLASFEHLSEFIKKYLESVKGIKLDDKTDVEVVFNKDVLINESQVIGDIRASAGILSMRTLIENHPYTNDIKEELDRLEEEKQKLEEEKLRAMEEEYKISGADNLEE